MAEHLDWRCSFSRAERHIGRQLVYGSVARHAYRHNENSCDHAHGKWPNDSHRKMRAPYTIEIIYT
jgi:hypothetical protein